ncbi:hypothetical protein F7725_001938 [Dissostichus mawsoni]|uniref:G protein-activated inward rectifier potassium channel 1 n=1 Tax=Dissostichus mawsoni TaxID=36200 RepID=A0A7J5Y2T1_DISMA|nr:hypothetical protein F7725_001938 [Dissostichus mawsoni]
MSALRKKFGDDYQVVNTSSSGSGFNQPPPEKKRKRQRFVDKNGRCNVQHGNLGGETSRYLSDLFTTLVDLKWRWNLRLALHGLYVVVHRIHPRRPQQSHNDKYTPCVANRRGHDRIWLQIHHRQMPRGDHSLSFPVDPRIDRRCLLDWLHVYQDVSPKKRAETLMFSEHAAISMRDGKLTLMFRVGNLRNSHMVSAQIRCKLLKSRQTPEGEFLPLDQLELDVGFSTGADQLFLVSPLTICHVIDTKSPFYDLSQRSMQTEQFEIVVILEGIVETTGMTCQARTSYTEDEVLWGHRFYPVISLEEGFFKVDYSQFHATVKEAEEALLLSSPLMAPSLCNSGEKNSSLDCLETLEDNDSTCKLPTKLQKMSGREGLPKKLLRMSSTTSEMTYSFGDLPMKLQRISSVPGVSDDKLGGKASKMSEPMSKSVADLPPKLQRMAGGGGGRMDGHLPPKLRKMNSDRFT